MGFVWVWQSKRPLQYNWVANLSIVAPHPTLSPSRGGQARGGGLIGRGGID